MQIHLIEAFNDPCNCTQSPHYYRPCSANCSAVNSWMWKILFGHKSPCAIFHRNGAFNWHVQRGVMQYPLHSKTKSHIGSVPGDLLYQKHSKLRPLCFWTYVEKLQSSQKAIINNDKQYSTTYITSVRMVMIKSNGKPCEDQYRHHPDSIIYKIVEKMHDGNSIENQYAC